MDPPRPETSGQLRDLDSRRCVVSVLNSAKYAQYSVLSSASYAGYARDAGSVIAAGHCSCQHGTLITSPD